MISIEQQQITIHHKSYSFKEWCLSEMPSVYSDLHHFLMQWFDASDVIEVKTSGSTGTPKTYNVSKQRMINSAQQTLEFLKLQPGETALLCMNLKYIGAKMMVVRALVGQLNLEVVDATGHPLQTITDSVDFAAMVPLQLYNTLNNSEERKRLAAIKSVIIGGGAVDMHIQNELRSFGNDIYSTYGMTETLSHIALRRLSGGVSQTSYTPFPSVNLSLTPDSCLVIDAPLLLDAPLVTNDVAKIYDDGTFNILGRKDNVVNSGGIKIQIEQLEETLSKALATNTTFVVTSIPDCKLGEKVVMLCEPTLQKEKIDEAIQQLERYHQPKRIFYVDAIPLLENKKVDRVASKKMALLLFQKEG